jgi:hypothetical protein
LKAFVICCVTGLAVAACERPAERPTAAPQDTAAPQPVSSAPVTQTSGIDRDSLIGAWGPEKGGNFVWDVDTTAILFESDMAWHPYQIRGDTLLIDWGDSTIGIQRTRVLRLVRDTMVISDVISGTTETLFRLR